MSSNSISYDQDKPIIVMGIRIKIDDLETKSNDLKPMHYLSKAENVLYASKALDLLLGTEQYVNILPYFDFLNTDLFAIYKGLQSISFGSAPIVGAFIKWNEHL